MSKPHQETEGGPPGRVKRAWCGGAGETVARRPRHSPQDCTALRPIPYRHPDRGRRAGHRRRSSAQAEKSMAPTAGETVARGPHDSPQDDTALCPITFHRMDAADMTRSSTRPGKRDPGCGRHVHPRRLPGSGAERRAADCWRGCGRFCGASFAGRGDRAPAQPCHARKFASER